jgi:hypothetical protein
VPPSTPPPPPFWGPQLNFKVVLKDRRPLRLAMAPPAEPAAGTAAPSAAAAARCEAEGVAAVGSQLDSLELEQDGLGDLRQQGWVALVGRRGTSKKKLFYDLLRNWSPEELGASFHA